MCVDLVDSHHCEVESSGAGVGRELAPREKPRVRGVFVCKLGLHRCVTRRKELPRLASWGRLIGVILIFILFSVRLQIGTAQAIIYLRETWGTLSPRAGVRSLIRGVIGKDTQG